MGFQLYHTNLSLCRRARSTSRYIAPPPSSKAIHSQRDPRAAVHHHFSSFRNTSFSRNFDKTIYFGFCLWFSFPIVGSSGPFCMLHTKTRDERFPPFLLPKHEIIKTFEENCRFRQIKINVHFASLRFDMLI